MFEPVWVKGVVIDDSGEGQLLKQRENEEEKGALFSPSHRLVSV